MLDRDLAAIYGVSLKALYTAVRRNPERLPEDFMFRLTNAEAIVAKRQRFQSLTNKELSQPLAFTELGVMMLSAILRSESAIGMSVAVIRAAVTATPPLFE